MQGVFEGEAKLVRTSEYEQCISSGHFLINSAPSIHSMLVLDVNLMQKYAGDRIFAEIERLVDLLETHLANDDERGLAGELLGIQGIALPLANGCPAPLVERIMFFLKPASILCDLPVLRPGVNNGLLFDIQGDDANATPIYRQQIVNAVRWVCLVRSRISCKLTRFS